MSKVLISDSGSRVAKAKQRSATGILEHVRKHPIISDYLHGKISRRHFREMVGEKTFRATWERLAASVQELAQRAKQRVITATREAESSSLSILGVANSFLLWNLPDSYGAGPLERVRIVENFVWVFPIVLTSPGYGIVGEVGYIALDIERAQVVGCTPVETVQQRGRKCYERHKEEIEAAFLQARRV